MLGFRNQDKRRKSERGKTKELKLVGTEVYMKVYLGATIVAGTDR